VNRFRIESLRQPVRLGWFDEERSFPQVVTIDLTLEIDSEGAQRSDDVADTVDYTEIVSRVQRLCDERTWKLLERMTFEIVQNILEHFSRIRYAHISVRKHIIPAAQGVVVEYAAARTEIQR
jgi:7,8-dihydroneopterin aldolase/epimerase/oxygenase